MHSGNKQKELNRFFLWGFLLGALCFVAIFTIVPLNINMDGWLLKGELDLKQHYIGWLAYRNSPWSFPLCMTDKLSYPNSMSILYTDSIPLFAIFFKILSPLLPETFHYFGIYIMMSYALTGAFAARIIYRLTENKFMAFCMPMVFSLSYPMIDRSFYHSSLTAQWLILLGFELWLSGIFYESLKRQALMFAAVAFLCTSLHTYFIPMIFGIMCGGILEYWLASGIKKDNLKRLCIRFAVPVASFALAAFVSLYVLGAFSGSSTAGYYVGDFVANLNSLVNSMNECLLFKGLPLVSGMQGEGAAYLGAGIMWLLIFALAFTACAIVKSKKGLREILQKHPRYIALTVMSVVFVITAVFPVISINDKIVFTVPYPDILMKIFGVFRSNGRFMWPVMYLIMLAVCVILHKAVKAIDAKNHYLKRGLILIVLFGVIIQLVDFLPFMLKKHAKFDEPKEYYTTEWDDNEPFGEYKHFVSFQDDATYKMSIAYYAVRNNMTVNRFYFARDIDDLIFDESVKALEQIRSGNADPDTVYVFNRATYEDCKNSNLHFYKSKKCVYGTRALIEGKSELTAAELAEIKFP